MQTQATMGRDKLFNVRFSDDEWARLEKLCAFHGINAASLIRMLLKKEERELDARDPVWAPTRDGRKTAHQKPAQRRARRTS